MEKEHTSHHSHKHHSHQHQHRHHVDDSEIFKNKNLQGKKRRKLIAKILYVLMCIAAFCITIYAVAIYLLD